MPDHDHFLREAIDLAYANLKNGGRPFGAVIVKDGVLLARGVNELLRSNDPTAHAELLAIRAASQVLASPRLDGCVVYASGHPCPMCMAAMYLSGISTVYYAYSNEDGASYGLSTAGIYAEMAKPFATQSLQIHHRPVRSTLHLYAEWKKQLDGG